MENAELYHWGIKGHKWGIRRYQNKDGTLTPLGQKRYNQQVERLNKESARIAEAERVAANKREVKAQKDALKAQKAELAKRKKALKGKGDDAEAAKKAKENESIEERREKLLKSTDAKELYENRHLLSTNELNERLNRLDTEARLQGKLPKEEKKTGLDYINKAKNYIDATNNLYKSVDGAYSSVLNSTIGKTLAKKLGLSTPKESWIQEKMRKYKEGKLSAQEYEELNKYLEKEKSVNRKLAERKAEKEAEKEQARRAEEAAREAEERAQREAREAEKRAQREAREAEKRAQREAAREAREAETQRQVNDYNERWRNGQSDDRVTTEYATNSGRGRRESSNILGIEQQPTRLSDDDVEVIPPDNDWADRYRRYQESQASQNNSRNFVNNSGNTTASSVNSRTSSAGEYFTTAAGNIIPLLEDNNR